MSKSVPGTYAMHIFYKTPLHLPTQPPPAKAQTIDIQKAASAPRLQPIVYSLKGEPAQPHNRTTILLYKHHLQGRGVRATDLRVRSLHLLSTDVEAIDLQSYFVSTNFGLSRWAIGRMVFMFILMGCLPYPDGSIFRSRCI